MIVTIQRTLRNVVPLRSAFHFYLALRERAGFRRKRVLDDMQKLLHEHEDPWNYSTSPDEADRFSSASQMLEMAREDGLFENAFEVGCSEGAFTKMLAPRCKCLRAVDISQTALSRARQRCKGQDVRFEQWDLFTSPAPANLDLVVVMDVLELFFYPPDVRFARDKLVRALRPGRLPPRRQQSAERNV